MFSINGAALRGISSLAETLLCNDMMLTVSKTEASATMFDPGHTMILNLRTTIDGPAEPTNLGIAMKWLPDSLKTFAATDYIAATVESNRLTLKVGRKRRSFGLLDPAHVATPRMPPLAWDQAVDVSVDWLKSCGKSSATIKNTDVASLSIKDGILTWSITDEVTDFSDSIEMPGAKETSVMFTADYLSTMVAHATGSTVRLHLKDNYPIKMDFTAGAIEASLVLAPRIVEGG